MCFDMVLLTILRCSCYFLWFCFVLFLCLRVGGYLVLFNLVYYWCYLCSCNFCFPLALCVFVVIRVVWKTLWKLWKTIFIFWCAIDKAMLVISPVTI